MVTLRKARATSVVVSVLPPKARACERSAWPTLAGPTFPSSETTVPPPSATESTSGISKLVRTFAMYASRLPGRGTPLTNCPTSLVVPPMSRKMQSFSPLKHKAPTALFTGPLCTQRMGRPATDAISATLPSFCVRSTGHCSPASEPSDCSACATRRARGRSAAFRIAEFSRSSSPRPATSALVLTSTAPGQGAAAQPGRMPKKTRWPRAVSSSRTHSAAASSCSRRTGAKT
mmetsp:Transcript_99332/g.281292  ORF Transcript_99332/g.281292 Transcript_99332/m.281292 type:complete len:232 (-) Transcript_99332:94-789(-)